MKVINFLNIRAIEKGSMSVIKYQKPKCFLLHSYKKYRDFHENVLMGKPIQNKPRILSESSAVSQQTTMLFVIFGLHVLLG